MQLKSRQFSLAAHFIKRTLMTAQRKYACSITVNLPNETSSAQNLLQSSYHRIIFLVRLDRQADIISALEAGLGGQIFNQDIMTVQQNIRKSGGGTAGLDPAEHVVGPVSYTHLDVYKRQVYNCSVAMGEVFTMDLTITHFLLTFFSTLAYGGILTAVIAKAFGSEKVMFNA